jgi:hypothetical protein
MALMCTFELELARAFIENCAMFECLNQCRTGHGVDLAFAVVVSEV